MNKLGALLFMTVVILILVIFFTIPIWGNPIRKIEYYFRGHSYLQNKYNNDSFSVYGVEYDVKQDRYLVMATSKKYAQNFNVRVEKRGGKLMMNDSLFEQVMGNQLKSIVAQRMNEVYGGYKNISISLDCDTSSFSDVPDYYDVIYLVTYLQISISVNIDFNSSLQNTELRKLYQVIKEIEKMNPDIVRFSYDINDLSSVTVEDSFKNFIRPVIVTLKMEDFAKINSPVDIINCLNN